MRPCFSFEDRDSVNHIGNKRKDAAYNDIYVLHTRIIPPPVNTLLSCIFSGIYSICPILIPLTALFSGFSIEVYSGLFWLYVIFMKYINESVSVTLLDAAPSAFTWRGRSYAVKTIGFHHTRRDGRVLYHIFSLSDETTFFRLEFNTESLLWRLTDIAE